MKEKPRYLTRDEAADYLRISVRKLDQLAADGEIQYSKMGNGRRSRVLYRMEDLDQYIENHLVQIQSIVHRMNVI